MDFFWIFLESSNFFLRAKMRETKGFLRPAQGVRASEDANIGRLPVNAVAAACCCCCCCCCLLLLLLSATCCSKERRIRKTRQNLGGACQMKHDEEDEALHKQRCTKLSLLQTRLQTAAAEAPERARVAWTAGQNNVRRKYNTDRKWYRGMETGLGFEYQGWREVWGITRLGIKDAVSAHSRNIVPSKPCEVRGMERGVRRPYLMALLYDA